MAKAQRDKGARGEREVARIISDLLGFAVSRRCRQHDGDCDLEGVTGWSIEVKNHSKVTRSILMGWWQQALEQSGELAPCLWYKRAPGWWRVMWLSLPAAEPGSPRDGVGGVDLWEGTGFTSWDYTNEGEPEAWAAVVREFLPNPLTNGKML